MISSLDHACCGEMDALWHIEDKLRTVSIACNGNTLISSKTVSCIEPIVHFFPIFLVLSDEVKFCAPFSSVSPICSDTNCIDNDLDVGVVQHTESQQVPFERVISSPNIGDKSNIIASSAMAVTPTTSTIATSLVLKDVITESSRSVLMMTNKLLWQNVPTVGTSNTVMNAITGDFARAEARSGQHDDRSYMCTCFNMSGKDDKKIKEGTSKIKEIGSTTHFQCPMLKGANYTTWAIRMQVILEANGLWEMIEPKLTTEVDTKKDKTAIAYIYQSLPEEQLLLISKYKTAKEVWDALKTRHVGVKTIHLLQVEGIINISRKVGLAYEDSTLVRKLLNAVPDRFLQIVASIEQYSDLGRDAKENLLENVEDLTSLEAEKKTRTIINLKGKNERLLKKIQETNLQGSYVTDVENLGHYAYECPNKRKNQVREQSNLIEEDLEPTLLMATITEKK
ncbi:zinc finger, CCHC-type containing protein [Tanacetum coccineum]